MKNQDYNIWKQNAKTENNIHNESNSVIYRREEEKKNNKQENTFWSLS